MPHRLTFNSKQTAWLGFGAVIVLFAIYFLFSLQLNRQLKEEAVEFQENFIWAVFQTQKELLNTLRLADKAVHTAETDPDELLLSFDVMVSRLLLLKEGQGFDELSRIPDFQNRVGLILQNVGKFDEFVAQNPRPDELGRKFLELFGPTERLIQELSLDALHYAADRNTIRNQDVRRRLDGLMLLYLLNTLMIGGSIFLAFRQAIRARESQFRAETESRERKFLEDSAEAAKLQALGTLAGGVAHEINSPAQFITSNLEFSREATEKLLSAIDAIPDRKSVLPSLSEEDFNLYRTELPAALSEASSGLNRIAEIVRAVKAFAHPSDNPNAEIDVNEEIDSAVLLTANQTRTVIRVIVDKAVDLPTVLGKRNDLNQVFINLIINSAQAISDMPEPPADPEVRISSRVEGRQIVVSVSDNGPGIPAKLIDRIFDPFFTTKPIGIGSGQGLAISQKLVMSSFRGVIDVVSQENEGTTFFIRLPILDDQDY